MLAYRNTRPTTSLKFPEFSNSMVWLVGQVRWSNPETKALDDPGLKVVVKVGDCRQLPVELRPRGLAGQANVREFLGSR